MKISFTLLIALLSFQMAAAQFSYVNPVPGSQYHNPQTNIILKNGSFIDRASVADKDLIEIYGSVSGKHSWTARLSDDNKTVVIKPNPVFNYGETVSVTVHPELKKNNGDRIEGATFNFKIRDVITPEEEERFRESRLQNFIESFGYDPTKKSDLKITYPLDSMPTFKINVNNNPAPGRIFYCNNQDLDESDTNSFPTIIENDGTIVWARDLGKDGHDFKINKNGYLTYYKYSSLAWMEMDSNFNVIDSFKCGNGYELETNAHDLQIYPDGHAFLFAFNDQTVDMTAYGGQPNADVKGVILQELDVNKDVVFEWSSWDHFLLTDANNATPLTNGQVDPVHTNAINRDFDGNVLISSRNMDELTKIDHNTGNIIWRMGGENNQFTFVNDNIPQHFSEQHDVRRIANGNITIFNNGNYLPTQISSAKEYAVDEVNKVATLAWYYEHPYVGINPVFGRASGNAQRLPNGNTMISWGTIYWGLGIPSMSEVDVNKNIVWEMTFDTAGEKSYRTFKFEWNPCAKISGFTMKAIPKVMKTTLSWQPATGAKTYIINYRPLGTNTWIIKKTNKPKFALTGLSPSTSYEWRVKTNCSANQQFVSAFSVKDTFTTPPLKLDAEENDDTPGAISVYPVPASDHLTINLTEPEDAVLMIINTLGAVIYENKITSWVNGSISLDVSEWPAGIYIVQLKGDEHSFTQKILVE